MADITHLNQGIEIIDFDDGHTTSILISCDRETWRLERVLRTFRKALSLAYRVDKHCEFRDGLISLHDHKGTLTAKWRSTSDIDQYENYLRTAWEDDAECEIESEIMAE